MKMELGGLWRGAVARSIKGRRGQAALKELAKVMDAMPKKTLAAESLVTGGGEFCTLGVLGQARGLDMNPIDPDDWDAVAKVFNIAPAMVREIVYENDEYINEWEWQEIEICGPMRPYYPDNGTHKRSVRVPVNDAPERRWRHMRDWTAKQIKEYDSAAIEAAPKEPT